MEQNIFKKNWVYYSLIIAFIYFTLTSVINLISIFYGLLDVITVILLVCLSVLSVISLISLFEKSKKVIFFINVFLIIYLLFNLLMIINTTLDLGFFSYNLSKGQIFNSIISLAILLITNFFKS